VIVSPLLARNRLRLIDSRDFWDSRQESKQLACIVMIRLRRTIMTVIKAHLSGAELEARYKTAVDPIGKSHFHALWLLWCGYELDEVAELLSFSPRWVRALLKR
jgi:hypothetical protein